MFVDDVEMSNANVYRSLDAEDIEAPDLKNESSKALVYPVSGETDALVSVNHEDMMPHRQVILITIAEFMGYAILVTFQVKLKHQLGIPDGDNTQSHQFSFATSFLYIGNLVFRLMHNVFFFFLTPRQRVFLSMASMCVSMFFLGFCVFIHESTWIGWVFLAYALGGISIGSFESNLLSCITPLGHATKVWAIIGFPTGFAMISIVGFALTAFGVPTVAIYISVFVLVLCGIAVFALTIPHSAHHAKHGTSFSSFVEQLYEWRHWLPQIYWHASALTVDMFCVSLFSGVMLYIFNGDEVPLFGINSTSTLPHDWFFVIHNSFTLVGDSVSRKLMYVVAPRNPWQYLLLCAVGAAMCLSKLAIIAPLGIFLVFFTNGCVYATSTRHIDANIDHKYNLIALSVWLFIGDIGSVAGSNTLAYIRDAVCTTATQYVCKSSK